MSVFLRVPIRARELFVAGFSACSSEHPASKLNGATMFRIITIEREYGCGAGEIAQKLADRLRWKLWDQLLAHEVARHARCKPCEVEQREERRDPIYYRLLKSFVRGSYEGALRADQVEMLDADSIFHISKRVIEQAASDGECVIVGRGSQLFLEHRRDALRVFLYAPVTEKVQRLVSEGSRESDAQILVDTVDRERAAFIRKYFGVEWPNREIYHAMFNTAAGDQAVIDAILCLMHTPATARPAESLHALPQVH
ncbi:MAG TPA: cytidylate kinase-like family protein [Candidatus Angelobacter sp.]|nr:cytidylate kinase-like family protein [Candidatus Angelobacter sp.]